LARLSYDLTKVNVIVFWFTGWNKCRLHHNASGMRRLRLGMMAGGIPLDPDAVAFLTAAGITDATITTAIDTLVTDLKGYGVWTKMKAIYPLCWGNGNHAQVQS